MNTTVLSAPRAISAFAWQNVLSRIVSVNAQTVKRTLLKKAPAVMAVCALLVQGCATTPPPNLDLTRSNFDSVQKLTVVRYKTPDLDSMPKSAAICMAIGSISFVTCIVGLIIYSNASHDASRGIPDFGELMMKDFVSTAGEEISGWPPTTSVDAPVKAGYQSKDTALIIVDTKGLSLGWNVGLVCAGDVIMVDSRGQKIFLKHFFYKSLKTNLQLLADNHKPLKEELSIAAETCAKAVVASLKSNLDISNQAFSAGKTGNYKVVAGESGALK